MNNGNIIDKDGFIGICKRLQTGMILRCAAVCKNWSELCKSDDLWILIMGFELKGESRLSWYKNISLNKRVIMLWKKEFARKYGDASVKDVYMRMRRERIRIASMANPGYKQNVRVFPVECQLRWKKEY